MVQVNSFFIFCTDAMDNMFQLSLHWPQFFSLFLLMMLMLISNWCCFCWNAFGWPGQRRTGTRIPLSKVNDIRYGDNNTTTDWEWGLDERMIRSELLLHAEVNFLCKAQVEEERTDLHQHTLWVALDDVVLVRSVSGKKTPSEWVTGETKVQLLEHSLFVEIE